MINKSKAFIVSILLISIIFSSSVVNAVMYLPTGMQEILKDAIIFYAGSNIALVNNVPTPIDESNKNVKPFIYILEYDNENIPPKEFAYIPLKFIAEIRGATIEVNENEYIIKYKDKITKIRIGNHNFYVNDNLDSTLAVPVLKDNEIYIDEKIAYHALDLIGSGLSSGNTIVLFKDDKSSLLGPMDYSYFNYAFKEDIENYMKTIGTKTRISDSIVLYQGSPYAIVNDVPREIVKNNKIIKPILIGGRNIVPLRFISESMGATVEWDNKTYTATINLNGTSIKVTKGKNTMYVDGKKVSLETPASIYGDSIYVPLRAISEAFGKKVFFDRKVIIISDKDDKAFKYINEQLTNNLEEFFKFIDLKSNKTNTLVMYQDSPYAILNKNPTYIDRQNKEIKPVLLSDYNVVPLRFISENFGATVEWEPNTFTAIIRTKNKTVRITKGKNTMEVDGIEVDLQVAAGIFGESMYVPLRAISEALGKKVFFDRKVIVISDTDMIDGTTDKQLVNNLIEYFNNRHSLEEGQIISELEKSMVDDLIKYFENKRKEDIKAVNNNSPNNMINKGLAAKQGEWIYYSSRPGTLNPEDGLWKMKEDGSHKVKLDNGRISYINVIDDWIYYVKEDSIYENSSIQKIKIDGSEKKTLVGIHPISKSFRYMSLYYANDGFYYTIFPLGEIYKVRLDGKVDRDYSHYKVSNIETAFVDNNAYYTPSNINPQEGNPIFRFNLDTGKLTKMNNDRSNHINIMGDYIYYSNVADKNKIYRIKNIENTNEIERKKITDDAAWEINCYNGWIYYSNLSDSGNIYKIKPDGTGKVKLTNIGAYNLNIVGDWIYFWSGAMHRVKTDGSKLQKL